MPVSKTLAPLILAAGFSRRFNGNKLAHPLTLNGVHQPLLLHTLTNWLAVFETVFLMLPASDVVLKSLIETLPKEQQAKIQLVFVDKPEHGMSESIKAGVKASQDASGWLIGLADMPWITATVLSALEGAMLGDAEITAPFFNDQRGHPVAFNTIYREALLALEGDRGAKTLLQTNKAKIHPVLSSDDGVLRDIDTQADI